MTKLLLLQPPIEDFYDTNVRLQPIGLAFLKASVRKYFPGLDVKIVDLHHGWGRRTVALPRELSYLRDYYPYPDNSPFCAFHHYYRFGASPEQIRRVLREEKPDLVAISSLFSPYFREVLETARLVKEFGPVPVLLGGSHVSADPLEMLKPAQVDFIIRGEGERPLVEFLREWLAPEPQWARVSNLGWKEHGRPLLNEMRDNFPLEDLPSPDLGDFQPDTYRYAGKPLAFLVTSRSCPHRCSFCSVHATFGFNYRRLSVDRVLAEIEARHAEGYRVLDFEDDNLSFYTAEMKDLCRRLIARFPPGELQLLAMNGISYLSLDSELLHLMRAAGFTHLNLALVTSDTTVRETTKRPHTLAKYREVVQEAAELGFSIVSYQILGLPTESLESMIQTLSLAARLPVLLGASPFYLTPNSPIAKQMGHVANETDSVRARLTAFAVETPHFRREDLYTLFLATRVIDFLKGLNISHATVSFPEILEQPAQFSRSARDELGLEILKRFFATGDFCAATPSGLQILPRFQGALFLRAWEALSWIQTKDGGVIKATQNTFEGNDESGRSRRSDPNRLELRGDAAESTKFLRVSHPAPRPRHHRNIPRDS